MGNRFNCLYRSSYICQLLDIYNHVRARKENKKEDRWEKTTGGCNHWFLSSSLQLISIFAYRCADSRSLCIERWTDASTNSRSAVIDSSFPVGLHWKWCKRWRMDSRLQCLITWQGFDDSASVEHCGREANKVAHQLPRVAFISKFGCI
jgi:hypothetical protein